MTYEKGCYSGLLLKYKKKINLYCCKHSSSGDSSNPAAANMSWNSSSFLCLFIDLRWFLHDFLRLLVFKQTFSSHFMGPFNNCLEWIPVVSIVNQTRVLQLICINFQTLWLHNAPWKQQKLHVRIQIKNCSLHLLWVIFQKYQYFRECKWVAVEFKLFNKSHQVLYPSYTNNTLLTAKI